MLDFLRAKHSRMLVWTLVVLIVIGLAGFGISTSGALSGNDVASVGGRAIASDAYARAMDQELRTISNQLGRNLTLAEARQYGIDNMVLTRLVNDAALDEEAGQLGISTGDATVRDQVLGVQGFQGADGKFDRQAYTFALRRNGLDPATFEDELRRESARELIAASVESAVAVPDIAAATILDYQGERRGFDWLRLDASLLPEPVPAPTEAQVAEEYKANPARYTRPETRKITYASVTPEELAATLDVPEADLRAAYDAAPDRFNTPEKRVLDRVGFATEAEAAAATARLDAGEIDFDALASERGFTPEQIDQGEVAAASLGPEARDAVFGAAGPGIVGPVPSPLGPSLYRINAILAASSVPFETAREELRQERALKLAEDKILAETATLQDLVAGGATLEEMAAESEMTLRTLDLTAQTTGGIADDPKFRELASTTEPGETTDLAQLDGGGVVSLRVDAIEPPALIPLAEVRDRAVAAWTADETDRRLTALAQGFVTELDQGLSFEALAARLGRRAEIAGPLLRSDTLPGTPPGLIAAIFAAPADGAAVAPDVGGAILARVSTIEAFDPATEQNKAVLDNAKAQLRGQLADDLLALYTAALRNSAGVTVNQSQIEAVMTRFP